MERIRSDNIDCVDIGVTADGVEVFVVVTVFFRDAVLALPVLDLRRGAADHAGQFGHLTSLHSVGYACTVTAEAHDGHFQHGTFIRTGCAVDIPGESGNGR